MNDHAAENEQPVSLPPAFELAKILAHKLARITNAPAYFERFLYDKTHHHRG